MPFTKMLDQPYLYKREYRNLRSYQQKKSKEWITPPTLALSATQFLAKRYFSPIEKHTRGLIKKGPGTGKTLTSLIVALAYIKIFDIINKKLDRPYYVHILGFSKSIYKAEFLKFPELNIITYDELHQLNTLKELSLTVAESLRDKIRDDYKKLKIKITKRITDTSTGGMYNFVGYKELFNNLFSSKLPSDTYEYNIMEYYNKSKFSVNELLLRTFKNSLIICDEVHLAYNSENINNYGLAIQFIIDYFKNNITALYLSATFLNNDKREIISIANLARDPDSPHFKSEDFFSSSDKDKVYDVDKLKPIYAQLRGKVIFLEETGTDYPELILEGELYPKIKYLHFDEAKMSPLHEQTFRLSDFYNNTTSKFVIMDMVFPNPEFTHDEIYAFHPDISETKRKTLFKDKDRMNQVCGIFDNETCISLIKNADAEWRSKIGINVKEDRNFAYLSGAFLRYNNLRIYSSKYCLMLDIIFQTLKANPYAKFIIYHPYVRGSGIMVIGEILSENGFVNENMLPNGDTYSAEEFITQREWVKKYPHREFVPSRYFVVQFDVTENQKSDAVDKWNTSANRYGFITKFFIGAGKIKQSLDFKNTTEMIITHKPNTMSDYIQIKGRIVRKKSLIDLPPNMQKVHLHTLLSTGEKPNALEPRKYAKKILEFDNIRAIEDRMNREAINNYMFDDFKPIDVLGAFPYHNDNSKLPKKISDDTFYLRDFYQDTINEIMNQIKRAFISVPVWKYDSLYNFVVEHSGTIDITGCKNLFNVVLYKMVYDKKTFIYNHNVILFDNENIIINEKYINGVSYETPGKVIMEYGDYFVLTTINSDREFIPEQDMFLIDNVDDMENYIIDINKDKVVKKIAIKKLMESIRGFNAVKMETFSYVFLFSNPADSHYTFMRDYLTNPKCQIPEVLINMYKKLRILEGTCLKEGSWYEERYARLILNKEGNFTNSDKPISRKEDNYPIMGIVADGSFKIRDLRNDNTGDNRNVRRGIGCVNVSKPIIFDYIELLGIKIDNDIKTKDLCKVVLKYMIDMEIESRAGKNNKKYVYLFNE
jgi:hypothetical protein